MPEGRGEGGRLSHLWVVGAKPVDGKRFSEFDIPLAGGSSL